MDKQLEDRSFSAEQLATLSALTRKRVDLIVDVAVGFLLILVLGFPERVLDLLWWPAIH